MKRTGFSGVVLSGAVALAIGASPAAAQPAASQPAGGERPVSIVLGFGVGGIYHSIAMLLSRHMGRHLPGQPTVIVRNMPGAGSLIAANYIANAAPKDGSALGIIGGGTVLEPLFGNDKAKYDPRQLAWLGSMTTETNVCTVWHTVPVDSIDDVKQRQVIAGSTGRGSRTLSYPLAMNQMLGTKFKVVTGYQGGNQISQALEQGEVESYCGWAWGSLKSRSASWLAEKKLKFLVQFGFEKSPDLPDVPMVLDLIKDPADRAAMRVMLIDTLVAWPLVAPGGMARAKVDALRAAYLATMEDPAVVTEAAKLKLEIRPVKGEALQDAIARIYDTPKDVVARARALSGIN